MEEILDGIGQLEDWDIPDSKHEVRYRFSITTKIVETPGFEKVQSQRSSRGTVNSTSGERLGDGFFRLHTQDEILKVKNLGGVWYIVAS